MATFTCRYGESIHDLPDRHTMCLDQCEGMGAVPVKGDDMSEPWRSLWLAAEAKAPADDGWHFVKCPACNGTGTRPDPQ